MSWTHALADLPSRSLKECRLEESIGLKKANSPSQGVQFAEQDLQQPLHGSGHIGASQASVVPCKLYSAPPINSATTYKISVIE